MSRWGMAWVLAALAVVCVTPTIARAQVTHEITVELDDATAGDDDLLLTVLSKMPLGELPQGLRKLAAGSIIEVQLLLAGRLDGDLLTLDDGTVVTVGEDDFIKAKKKKKCKEKCEPPTDHGAVIVRKGHGHPIMILIQAGDCLRVLDWRFYKDGTGRPFISVECKKL